MNPDSYKKERAAPAIEHAPMLQLNPGTTEEEARLRSLTSRFLNHEFNILGSGWVRVYYGMQARGFEGMNYSDTAVTRDIVLGSLPDEFRDSSRKLMELAARCVAGYEPIDWHIDIKSGFRSPLLYHRDLSYGQVEGVDMKVTADLSRLYHLPMLGRMFQHTNDERWRDEVLAQVFDWHAANPFEYGPAWRANMNVAIRVVNLIVAYELVRPSLEPDRPEHLAFMRIVQESLVHHRRYICANLEFPEDMYHPNHYVANLAGLLVTCAYVRGWDIEADAWFALAMRELRCTMEQQVQDDGVQYENATAYHALVLEMLAVGLVLAARLHGRRDAETIREWIASGIGTERMDALRMMFRALAAFTGPAGTMPQVGDVDGGRFVYLEPPGHAADDWRFLCCLGATLFNDSSLALPCVRPDDWSTASVLLGDVLQTSAVNTPRSCAFPTAGFYLMKSSEVFCMISAGPVGTAGKGGHAHNDKLAFTLEIAGKPFFVDPGIYVYTASEYYRNLYRSTMYHNTAMIAAEEQNRPNPDSKWWGCCDDTRCCCREWRTDSGVDIFAGEHRGYTRLRARITHHRKIRCDHANRSMLVTDRFTGAGPEGELPSPCPDVRLNFMLHPDCRVEPDGAVVRIEQAGVVLTLASSCGEWRCDDAWFSPTYGVKQRTARLELLLAPGTGEHTTRIQWQ